MSFSSSAALRQRHAKSMDSTSGSDEGLTTSKVELKPNIFGVMWITFLIFAAAYAILYVTPTYQTIAFAIFWYLLCGFADSAGYHRLWAHKSYEASFFLKVILLILGSANFTGPVIDWARNHRAHHRQPDTSKDPFNRSNGFFFAFLGHHFIDKSSVGDANITDLKGDLLLTFQKTAYPILAISVGWVLPAFIAAQWDDPIGGFFYGGIVRTFFFVIGQSFFWALGRTYGYRPYNDAHSARNNIIVSICTLGDGYLNFHYEFSSDYRIGCFYYHLDATKWLLRAFSVLGLARKFNKTPYEEILKVRVQKKQAEVDEKMKQLNFGPDPSTLPLWTMEQFEKKIADGEKLLIIDYIVHDVKNFMDQHPGGIDILLPKIGKDATVAFNGGVQRHSKAARNLATFMRIARLERIKLTKKKLLDEIKPDVNEK